MSAATATATAALAAPWPWWRGKVGLVVAIVLVIVVSYIGWKSKYPWPAWLTWDSLGGYLDRFQNWLSAERNVANPSVFFTIFNKFASFLDSLVSWLTSFFLKLRWAGTTVLGVVVVLRFGSRRAALGVFLAFLSFALMGLWLESVQTFSLMIAAVTLSLAIGMPLGVLAGRSDRFQAAITPVLDAMQIIPAFAYLIPVVILFSVGPGAAVVTTMVYAIPPAIRITALGIRGVPTNTVEAAQALGSTRKQVLWKVQLPLARKMLLLSVNQVILFALSMVVIAGLIGGPGLGNVVTTGLYSNPALAILAGFAIVIMAIALDRATESMAERTDPAHRHITDDVRRRLHLESLLGLAAVIVAVALSYAFGAGGAYTGHNIQAWLLTQIQAVLDYIQNPAAAAFSISSPIGNFMVEYGLQPLNDYFSNAPWFAMLLGLSAIALVISGRRPAITVFVMFVSIGVMGQWNPAMSTASQVLVATAIAVALGFALGVWAAESRTVAKIVRPINDVLQTLPQLVYIIPFIYLMPVSIVPGIIAAVLYATPVVMRLVQAGIRDVEPNTVEAARSFGATKLQVLAKVKIPLARDAIMLGVNQGIIMVLAVVVIGGLVGSGGLGYEVAQGLQRNEFGQGVLASLSILALGIALDRVTQGSRKTRQALDL